MACNNVECEYCNTENYEFSELCCVRCELKGEMKECKTCKINNNKLKKANDIFPDAIVDLINSFNACKRCIKTINIMKNEPKNMNNAEMKKWYFVKLNPFPSRRMLNEYLDYKERLEVYNASWMVEYFENYLHYQNWFNELWKSKEVSSKSFERMMKILRFMFRINVFEFRKLEYDNIFNKEFFKNNVYHYIDKNTTIR